METTSLSLLRGVDKHSVSHWALCVRGIIRSSQGRVLLVADMVDGELGQAVQALKAGNDGLAQRAVEVERQLLELCALAEQLDQCVRDRPTVSGSEGRECGLILGRSCNGKLPDVAVVGRRDVSDVCLHSFKASKVDNLGKI